MPSKKWTLDGKTALVTGASRGIGLACARELSALGAQVILAARGDSGLRDAVDSLKGDSTSAHGVTADVASEQGRLNLLKAVQKVTGHLDVLVNNAGGASRGKFSESGTALWMQQLELNLISAAEMSRLFHPLLKSSGSASVINICSIAAHLSVANVPVYGSTKAALAQLTRSLAVEWAIDGIRVNGVSPWFTRTAATEKPLENAELVQTLVRRTPLNRIAQADEIAGAVAFLSLPASSYVTGQILAVDGGMSIFGV